MVLRTLEIGQLVYEWPKRYRQREVKVVPFWTICGDSIVSVMSVLYATETRGLYVEDRLSKDSADIS